MILWRTSAYLTQIMIMFVYMILTSACAPQAWKFEAEEALFYGDAQRAFFYYESLVINGRGEDSQVATETLELLIQQKILQLRILIEQEEWQEACLVAQDLERLSPDQVELELFFNPLSSHSISHHSFTTTYQKYISRVKTLEQMNFCMLEFRWPEIFFLRQSLFSSLQADFAQVEKIEEIVEHDVYLNDLEYQMGESQFDLFPHQISELHQQLYSLWLSFWDQQRQVHLQKEEWGALILIEYLREITPSSLYVLYPHQEEIQEWEWRAVNHKNWIEFLESQAESEVHDFLSHQVSLHTQSLSKEIQLALATHTPELPKPPVVSRNLPKLIKAIEPEKMSEVWSVRELKADCQEDLKKSTHTIRYLDHQRESTSAQYQRALQRVEKQQELLEAAQSQRDELKTSLTRAHEQLQGAFTELTNAQHHEIKLQQDTSILSARSLHLLTHIKQMIPSQRPGPPAPKELTFVHEVEEAIETLKKKQGDLKIQMEIALEAKRELEMRLNTRRDEVTRLSRYLAQTDQEVKDAEILLEEREHDFKLTKKIEHEDIYSVFRYPVQEHHLTCQVQWETIQQGKQGWVSELTLTDIAIANRAFPRYKVSAHDVDLHTLKLSLMSRIRARLATQLSRWLDARRIAWLHLLSKRWSKISDQIPNAVKTHLLGLLAFYTPEYFSEILVHHLTMKLNLNDFALYLVNVSKTQ